MTWRRRLGALSGMGGYVKPEAIDGALKLDSNENLAMPKRFQQEILAQARAASDVRQYPLGGAERLVSALSSHLRVPEAMIGVGSGSDQILDLLLSGLVPRGTRILAPEPSFAFFEDRCRLHGMRMSRAGFDDDMRLDTGRIQKELPRCGVLYIDSPNNPTGFQLRRSELESLISGFDGLVIVDEAYVMFGRPSALPLAKKRDNVVVIQTLSKGFGLAGLRAGYMVASPEIAGAFSRVLQYPYPLSTVSIEAAVAALERSAQAREAAELVKAERRRVIAGLRAHDSFAVFDSQANFVLFDAGGADKRVSTALAEQGISVRRIGKIGRYRGCLRVTIGTREMNSRFLLAVRDLLG